MPRRWIEDNAAGEAKGHRTNSTTRRDAIDASSRQCWIIAYGRATRSTAGSRKLFLLGCERLDEQDWERLHQALRDGDLTGEVHDTGVDRGI